MPAGGSKGAPVWRCRDGSFTSRSGHFSNIEPDIRPEAFLRPRRQPITRTRRSMALALYPAGLVALRARRQSPDTLDTDMLARKLLRRESWLATMLAAAQLLVAIGLALFPNPEGWPGGIFYAGMYALPLLLIGLALRSPDRRWHLLAGWASLILAIFYCMVVIGNWSGYSSTQVIFAVVITAPTVAIDLLISWTTLLQGLRPGSGAQVTS